MSARIAYFINQYPKVSHSFIRREIAALERLGFEIQRFALRGWEGELADSQDHLERTRTRYLLERGPAALLPAVLAAFLASPRRFVAALGLAIRMGRGAERPLPYHLVYFAEACCLLAWLKAFGATHLHAHFGTNSAEVAMLAHRLGGPPFSFTVHGPEEFDKAQSIGIAEKARRAAFVVAVSSFGRSQLYRWLEHRLWAKVRVVHCGLEPAFHAIAAGPPPALARLVCVGRLCREKGQLLLIEAMQRLAARGIVFDLVLAGDGEMRADIEAQARRSGLAGRVRITGWLSGALVRDEILAARALVLPSLAEGLPVALMEAMALGRPVLTTLVAGIPELVRHGENGWLFPAGSVEDLAAAIEDCLRRPVADLMRMGEAASQRVRERHAIDRSAAQLAALFRAAGGVR